MKTFQIPVSDTGNFVVGKLDDDTIKHMRAGNGLPEDGIIIWYKDKATAMAAMQAVMNAHWPEKD